MPSVLCDNEDEPQFVLSEPLFSLLFPVVLSTYNCQFLLSRTITMATTTSSENRVFKNLIDEGLVRDLMSIFEGMSESSGRAYAIN